MPVRAGAFFGTLVVALPAASKQRSRKTFLLTIYRTRLLNKLLDTTAYRLRGHEQGYLRYLKNAARAAATGVLIIPFAHELNIRGTIIMSGACWVANGRSTRLTAFRCGGLTTKRRQGSTDTRKMTTGMGPDFRQVWSALSIALGCLCLPGCVATLAPAKSQVVDVAPIAEAPATAAAGLTRTELQDDVMRFADRFSARMVPVADRLLARAQTVEERWLAMNWKMLSREAVLAIAVGPNAVTNLLDMVVLVSLARLQLESYWVPRVIGVDEGEGIVEAVRSLETDIWSLADKVLKPGEQQALMVLIRDWHETYSNTYYFWDVRFGAFSGQRAAELERVAASGGLLGQVQQTRETIGEVRDLGERVLYYMQNAPVVLRLQAQVGAYEMLRLPEMQQLLSDAEQFNASVERLAVVAESLPKTIDQFMERVSEQREGLREDLLSEEGRIRAVAADLQQTIALGNQLATNVNSTVQSVDKLVSKLGRGAEAETKQQFDIRDYQELVVDASHTAGELTALVQSLSTLVSAEAWDARQPQALQIVYEIDTRLERLMARIFLLLVLLIVVFFLALFAYRYAMACTGIGSKSEAA